MGNLDKIIKNAAEYIRKGDLVVFPTETVYGLGAGAFNVEAIKKIYKAKNRPEDNPLIVHIGELGQLNLLTGSVGEIEHKLIQKFWPGPLTILFKKSEKVPQLVTAGSKFVAVRLPANEIAIRLIQQARTPIAAPSANISTKVSPTDFTELDPELLSSVSLAIDGGKCEKGLESTVIKVTKNRIQVLRLGAITIEEIHEFVSQFDSMIRVEHVLSHVKRKKAPDRKVLSPGLLLSKHYSPKTPLIIIKDANDELVERMRKELSLGKNIALLCSDNLEIFLKFYFPSETSKNLYFINIGSENNLELVAKNLYSNFIKLDKLSVDYGLIQLVLPKGLGLTINDRITRASKK